MSSASYCPLQIYLLVTIAGSKNVEQTGMHPAKHFLYNFLQHHPFVQWTGTLGRTQCFLQLMRVYLSIVAASNVQDL